MCVAATDLLAGGAWLLGWTEAALTRPEDQKGYFKHEVFRIHSSNSISIPFHKTGKKKHGIRIDTPLTED
jgi:hypothetical protein